MTKTPEQMAEEYGTGINLCCGTSDIIIAAEKGFLAGYQAAKDQTNLPTSAKWISVKERLPEQGQCVLIYNPLEYVSIVMANYYNVTRPFFDHVTLDDIHFTIYPDEEKQLHWMPLPKPPEEK